MVLNNQLINSPMEFRSKLTLPHKANFGLELELDKVDLLEVKELVGRNIGFDYMGVNNVYCHDSLLVVCTSDPNGFYKIINTINKTEICKFFYFHVFIEPDESESAIQSLHSIFPAHLIVSFLARFTFIFINNLNSLIFNTSFFMQKNCVKTKKS